MNFFDQHVLTHLPNVHCRETGFYLKAYRRIPSASLFNLTFPKAVQAYVSDTFTANSNPLAHWDEGRQLLYLYIQRNIHDLTTPIVEKLNKTKLPDDNFEQKTSLQADILSFLGAIRTEMECAGVPLTTQPYASMYRTLFLDHILALSLPAIENHCQDCQLANKFLTSKSQATWNFEIGDLVHKFG
ncbi:hypothetical protein RUND412_002412 [Rhizina undulata]